MSNIVYHGSADLIDAIQPRRNVRMSADGGTIWDRVSFHATPHRWIALAYTRAKNVPETTGVDLYELKPTVDVYGRTTLDAALASLYGRGGYLHEFNAEDFAHEEGLGLLEVFSPNTIRPIRVTRIDDPVAEMRKEGIEFNFIKKAQPKQAPLQ
jgi:hypothetical protein